MLNQQNSGRPRLTETREGADQTEGVLLHASEFGETTLTKTGEGTDQIERNAFHATQFGETTHTATQEGVDQSERAMFSSPRNSVKPPVPGRGKAQTRLKGLLFMALNSVRPR